MTVDCTDTIPHISHHCLTLYTVQLPYHTITRHCTATIPHHCLTLYSYHTLIPHLSGEFDAVSEGLVRVEWYAGVELVIDDEVVLLLAGHLHGGGLRRSLIVILNTLC